MMLSLSFILSPIYNSPSLLKFYSYSDGNIMIVIKMVPYPAVMLWAVSFYKFPSLWVLIILPFFLLFVLSDDTLSLHPWSLSLFYILPPLLILSYILSKCCLLPFSSLILLFFVVDGFVYATHLILSPTTRNWKLFHISVILNFIMIFLRSCPLWDNFPWLVSQHSGFFFHPIWECDSLSIVLSAISLFFSSFFL